jgi:hypothetical protein
MRELTSPKHPAYTPNITTDGKGKYGYIRGYKWDGSVVEDVPVKTYRVLADDGSVEKILKI